MYCDAITCANSTCGELIADETWTCSNCITVEMDPVAAESDV